MTTEMVIKNLIYHKAHACFDCDKLYSNCNRCLSKPSFDKAIEAVEKSEKYKWHDLRKNPDDFPVDGRFVLVRFNDLAIDDYAICCLSNEQSYYDYVKCWEETSGEIHNLNYALAWKEIEPFEEEVEE